MVERFPVLGPEWLWRRIVRPEQLQRVRIHHALTTAWAVWRTRRRLDVLEVPEWKAQSLLLEAWSIVHLHLTLEVHYAWLGVAPSWKVRSAFWLERVERIPGGPDDRHVSTDLPPSRRIHVGA